MLKTAILISGSMASASLFESRNGFSDEWVLGPRAPSTASLSLHAMMKHSPEDVAELEKKLYDVSDPRSKNYGAHLTLQEIALIAPIREKSLDAVTGFFSSPASTVKTSPMRDIVSVTLPVAEAEKLIEAPIHVFTHKASGTKVLRVKDSYSLPDEVQSELYTIGDLLLLPSISRVTPLQFSGHGNWTNACATLEGCKGLITPAVVKQRYTVPDTDVGMEAANNSFAVAEFQGQHFDEKDLEKFSAACNVDVDVNHVIGKNTSSAGIEAVLDVEYIRGVSDKIDLTFTYAQQYSLLDWVTQLNSDEQTPWIHSVSYGNDEAQQVSTAYMESCNVQFMAAGLRRVSILFASGDQGVCGREGCGIGSRKSFKPDFPAGSPYITAVGGTDFNTPEIGEEKAWSAGGGGFSNTFPIPSYQAEAVSAYKANPNAELPPQDLWNNTGRGYPDVSALGGTAYPYCIVANGLAEGVAGTSAACPVAASIFARLNGIRFKAGKPSLGFLNPFIYQNAASFQDVTLGSNPGQQSGPGFKAIQGWDPATGVGTPDFEALSKVV